MAGDIKYTDSQRQQIIEYVVEQLVLGRSMSAICRESDMPHIMTVLRWLDADDEHADAIARARRLQADSLYDQITDICCRMESGELDEKVGKSIIWAKQWQAAKMRPQRYGDKQHIEHSGRIDYASMSDTDLDRMIAQRRSELEQEQEVH